MFFLWRNSRPYFITVILFASLCFINNDLIAQSIPQQTVPANGSTWETTTPTLSWLLYNTYSTVSFRVQLGLSASNFTSNYLIIDSTVSGGAIGQCRVPAGLLAVGVTYYWRIGYNGNFSTVWSFTPDVGNSGPNPIVLIPPTNNLPANNAINISLNPAVSWSSVTGANQYEVQVSSRSDFATTAFSRTNITSTSTPVNSLTPGIVYYWHVRASNYIGSSRWSSVSEFTTVPPLPSIPTLLTPANNSNGNPISLSLSWSHLQYDSAYTVFVSSDPNFGTLFTTINTTTNTVAVSGLSYNITYYWKVRGVNFSGTGNWSSIFNFVTKLAPPPPPILINPPNSFVPPTNCLFTWMKGLTTSNVTSFKLEISKTANFSAAVIRYDNLTDTLKLILGLSPQTQYYWHVKSYTSSDSSDWSTAFSFVTTGNQKNIYVDVVNGADIAQGTTPAGDGSILRPYKTINRAFTAQSSSFSDTIRVASGIYPEILNITFPIVIIGSNNPQIAAINLGPGIFNPYVAIVIKNITATFIATPINTGTFSNGINILNFSNVLLDNVRVTNFPLNNTTPALFIINSQNITVTNSDFSNDYHAMLIASSRNVTLSNITANMTGGMPPAINPAYGLYIENISNFNFTDLTFDSDDLGMAMKNVSNGTINNLRITNTGWFNTANSSFGALMIGALSSVTFNAGIINQNKMAAVLIDPTNAYLQVMQTSLIAPPYPNQNSPTNSINNLKFTGTYEFKNNYSGIYFTVSPIAPSGYSTNSPQFTGSFLFSGNTSTVTQPWMNTDFYISGPVYNLNVTGAQFINSTTYPSPYYSGPPTSQATSTAVFISNNNGVITQPLGMQPNGVVFNNCVFDQSISVNNHYFLNLTPYKVNARSNQFSYASGQFDIENMIYDSLDTQHLLVQSGRVVYGGSTFGQKLPPTISVGSLPVAYRGASYYLPVNIVTKGNSYNYLSGKFSYDASRLHYNGYLSNSTGLINQRGWTTLSVVNSVIHNTVAPDSGFIQYYSYGNAAIDSNGTLFKLNMLVQASAPMAGSPATGVAVIGGITSNFLGNNQPVFTYNPSIINYADPVGIVQSKGDVNLDGVVNMDDFMALLYHLLGVNIITNTQALSNADFNNDGSVNQTDLNSLFVFLNPGVNIVSPLIASGNITYPNATINGSAAMIVPVSLNNANNVNSLELVLNYDPAFIKFTSFTNALKLGDQYIQGIETNPGKAVFYLQSPNNLNGTNNLTDLKFSFESNSLPNNSNITSQYRINGGDYKSGPLIQFGSKGITAVEEQKYIPEKSALQQNYPNPFNPTTIIKYDIQQSSVVKLTIYDILGREVETLVNSEKSAGSYEVIFNGSKLSSGIYFYKIEAGNFTQSKKMILMK